MLFKPMPVIFRFLIRVQILFLSIHLIPLILNIQTIRDVLENLMLMVKNILKPWKKFSLKYFAFLKIVVTWDSMFSINITTLSYMVKRNGLTVLTMLYWIGLLQQASSGFCHMSLCILLYSIMF